MDKDGKPFKRRPTFGQTIKLIIEAENVVGKKYNLKLWEHDSWGGDDLLYNNTHTFKSDRQEVLIPLTHEMQTIGEIGIDPKNPNYGEYWTGNWQEIYAEVTLLYISTKSPIINVDIEEKPKVLDNGRSAWKMEKSEVEKQQEKVCECEEFKLIWGNKVSCKFRKKVVAIAKDLWPDNYKNMANNLMAVFAWETGETFKPDVPNRKKSGATGLIQFMPERAKEYFGSSKIETVPNYFNSNDTSLHNLPRVKEFAEMKAEDQLDYVKKYFEELRGKKLDFVDFYLQVLFPVSSGKPEHYVFGLEKYKNEIGLSTDSEKVRQKRIDKYAGNSSMDIFKDGKISKSEIALSIQPFITKGMPEIFKKGTQKVDENNKKTTSDSVVVTDAGHGINGDGGNSKKGNSDNESKMTLMIEGETANALKSRGLKNVRTRSSESLTVSENQITYRVNVARQNKAKVFVSHHLDYVPLNKDGTVNEKAAKSTNRIVVNIHPTDLISVNGSPILGGASSNFYKNSSSLASKIVIELKKIFTDRDVIIKQAKRPNISHDWLGVLKSMDGPDQAAVLIELGNTQEGNTKFLTTNKQSIGKAIATGIENYLGGQSDEQDLMKECESESLVSYIPEEKLNTNSSKWHHPVNNPQLRGWYSTTWAPENSIHSNNIPGRIKGKHDGIDLYAPAGTQIYSCINGEIQEIYVSDTYGNCINIKGEYNGKTYWFFYAHLSSISIKSKDNLGNPTKVRAGDPIGKSGKTGSSASALKPNQVHLHFEVRSTKERTGGRIDPFTNISELNKEVIKNPNKENQS